MHSNIGFIDGLKEMNIESNKASIEVHIRNIVDNFEYIQKDNNKDLSPLTKEHIDTFKNMEEEKIGLNIIEPMIGISTALYLLFDSIIDSQKALVQTYRKQFKSALTSTLEIAKHVKDQRIKDYSLKAADEFLKITA